MNWAPCKAGRVDEVFDFLAIVVVFLPTPFDGSIAYFAKIIQHVENFALRVIKDYIGGGDCFGRAIDFLLV